MEQFHCTTSVTLEELARARGLPADLLRQLGWKETPEGVAIPWPRADGQVTWHVRHALDDGGPNGKRWSWQAYDREALLPYGADHLQTWVDRGHRVVVVTESEVDAVALLWCGVPAIAAGSAGGWQGRWWSVLRGFERVVVWVEDGGSLPLLRAVVQTRPADGPEVAVAHSLPGPKDPGRILAADPAGGPGVVRRAVQDARPVEVVADLLQAVVDRLQARRSSSGYAARCPFHDDRTPSLSLFRGDDGAWAWRCHAGSCGASGRLELLGAALGLVEKGDKQPAREVSSVFSQGVPLSVSRSALLVRVPGFPLHAVPGLVRRYVEEVARGIDCPPDLVAVPLLGAAGATWGNRLAIRLTSTWVERAVVWAAVVADPGSAKSPALEAALAPLVALQRKAYGRWQAEVERWRRELAASRKDRGTAPPPPRPELEHFFTADATLEALARILGETPTPGLVVAMDEIGAWVRSFDAYHQRGERQRWLSLWSGAALKVDRATREPVFLEHPVVCVVGCITPDCLHMLEAEAQQEDGFIDRVLYAFPDTRPMRFVDAPPPQVDLVPVFERLRRCPAGEVVLSKEARQLFKGFVDRNAEAQEVERFRPLRRYRAKLPRHLARLALVLHALHHPDDPAARPVAAETMAAAVELVGYFLGHAHRVLLELGDGVLARRVLEALAAAGGQLSRTRIHEELGRHVRAADLQAVRDFLAAQGAIEIVTLDPGPRGGRPVEAWRLARSRSRGACEETEETSPQDTNPPCWVCGGTPVVRGGLCKTCLDGEDPGPGPESPPGEPSPPHEAEVVQTPTWAMELVEGLGPDPVDQVAAARRVAHLVEPNLVPAALPPSARAPRCSCCGGPSEDGCLCPVCADGTNPDQDGPDGPRAQAEPPAEDSEPEPPGSEGGLPWPLDLALDVPAREPTDRVELAQVVAALLKAEPVPSSGCVGSPTALITSGQVTPSAAIRQSVDPLRFHLALPPARSCGGAWEPDQDHPGWLRCSRCKESLPENQLRAWAAKWAQEVARA